MVVWFGACDDAVSLEGLEGRARDRGAVLRLKGFWGTVFGLQHADNILSGLKLHRNDAEGVKNFLVFASWITSLPFRVL